MMIIVFINYKTKTPIKLISCNKSVAIISFLNTRKSNQLLS